MGPITRQEKCFMRRMFTLNLNMYEEYKIKLKKKKKTVKEMNLLLISYYHSAYI